MIDVYATFGYNFLKVTIGDGVAHVKADRVQNDTFRKMCSFEIDRHLFSPQSLTPIKGDIAQQK
jgi:hypothetical protein